MNDHFLTFPITLQHFGETRTRQERRRLVLGTARRRDRHLAVVIPMPVRPSEADELRAAS